MYFNMENISNVASKYKKNFFRSLQLVARVKMAQKSKVLGIFETTLEIFSMLKYIG